jgi:hypothetical protein
MKIMKKILLILGSLLLFILSCQKQEIPVSDTEKETLATKANQTICLSDEMLKQDIASNPGRAKFLADLEEKTKLYEGRTGGSARGPGILYLPVVIHVVLTDTTLIPTAQIISQLQVWNKDFNKLNTELANTSIYLAGYQFNKVANCQIQFYISNIVRVQTTVIEFPLDESMKSSATGGSDPVDPATKLNVWVCNTPYGYSWGKFPGGPLLIDGIVIDYAFFGTNNPYFKGRVGTHEAGHWLNLRHIWGDSQCGNDQVQDTPKHFGSSTGCPAAGTKSTCAGKPLLMWMNYMDYSYGTCTYMFTDGQKKRMDATIDNARPAYFSTTKIYTDILP